jgi:TonB-dependent receptor
MNPNPCSKSRGHSSVQSRRVVSLCSAALALVLGVSPARAQETTPAQPPSNEAPNVAQPPSKEAPIVMAPVVVTGLRASLITAQEIKVNSPQFVDSIVAQDIGKLPDNTVADALQRMPGIQVARSAGEANSVVIRGLPVLETTINGYEVFTGTGRGVALQDIPAEMVAGVDAYKSINSDQLEGGVSGSIDIRLRRPLDFKAGYSAAANVRGMSSDQAKKNSYFLSGLVNYRAKTSNGDFGVLLDVSYQKRHYNDQIFDNWIHNPQPWNVAYDAAGVGGYYADNSGIQDIRGDRARPAAELAFQWKTNAGVELYSETLFTGYRNKHDNDFFIIIPSWGGTRRNVVLYPAGWDGVSIPDQLAINGPVGLPARWVRSFTAQGTNTIISKQAMSDYTNTVQGAFGAKWNKDNVKLDTELSYNLSLFRTRGIILDTIAQNNTQVWDITYNEGSNPSVQNSGMDFTSPNNIVASNLFDQWSKAYSAQYAVKTDALITLNNDLIKSVKLGGRFSSRSVHFHQANPSAYFGPTVPVASIPGLGGVESHNLFLSNSDMNVRSWWSPSTDFLLNNTDVIRLAAGHPLGNPPADPASTFNDEEKTLSLYGLANYKVNVGSMPLDGAFGVRFSDTHQTLQGNEHPVDATGASSGTGFRKSVSDKAYWHALPTVNGRLHITDALQLRFSATKTLTRPNFADLNPALSLFRPGPTSPGTGSGGNPNLKPIQSTNYDLSLEYYFSKGSQFTITGFDHKLLGYVQSFGTYEDVGQPTQYLITRPNNTGKGELKGYEVTYQQFLDFLSVDALKGLGFQVNYTGITGTTEDPRNLGTQQDITQVAKKNYNLILIYELGSFSSRLAYTYRGTYIDSYAYPGFQPTTVYVQPTKTMDFSMSYAIAKGLTVTFDATNILRSKYKDRLGETPMFNRDVRSYDRTVALGVRYNY